MLETVTAAEAQNAIRDLIDETAESHRPILIRAERANAVLLSEEDWNALQETLQLLSMSGISESIRTEMNADDEEFLSEEAFRAELEADEEK